MFCYTNGSDMYSFWVVLLGDDVFTQLPFSLFMGWNVGIIAGVQQPL
jgi:hypothetical protein